MPEQTTTVTEMPPATGGHANGAGGELLEEKKPSRLKPVLWSGLALAAVLLVIFGVRYWRFASTHTGTDDAFFTSDVIQIAPQVSGTVRQVLVQDNQLVQKGQLLVRMDDAFYRAAVQQARANLDAAMAAARGAGVSVALTQETGGAQTEQARAQVAQADAGISAAQADAARTAAAVATAAAQARGANANISTLQAGVTAASASVGRANAALKSAQAGAATAQAEVKSAQAGVDAAQAAYTKAARDAQRYAALADQGAVSRQMAEQAQTAEESARAALDAAREQLNAARATLGARQSDISAARQQVAAAEAGVKQAKAQVAAAKDQAAASQAAVRQARAATRAAEQGVHAAEARRRQALGQLSQANTAPRQVAVQQTAEAQALAKIEQMRAALKQAELDLSDTKIYAPATGRVSKKNVQVGTLVQPGAPLMAIVPSQDVWVVANLKETQMHGVRPGAEAEVEVDAIAGRAFHGHVDSIAAATGSTFALLPPDNASGNFTKVVQRIPVKIVLDAGQPALDRLRAGMSVNAIITTK